MLQINESNQLEEIKDLIDPRIQKEYDLRVYFLRNPIPDPKIMVEMYKERAKEDNKELELEIKKNLLKKLEKQLQLNEIGIDVATRLFDHSRRPLLNLYLEWERQLKNS